MSPATRASILLTAAAIWAAWVLGHYYALPFVRPDIVDGVSGVDFPFWHEAAARALRSLAGATVTLLAAWGLGRLCMNAVLRERDYDPAAIGVERVTCALTCGLVALAT